MAKIAYSTDSLRDIEALDRVVSIHPYPFHASMVLTGSHIDIHNFFTLNRTANKDRFF
jgi:hypothetical protein